MRPAQRRAKNSWLRCFIIILQHLIINKFNGIQFILSSILQIRMAYKKMMVDIAALLGAKRKDAETKMKEVYDLETKIAEVSFL